jgi:hypothetical protein
VSGAILGALFFVVLPEVLRHVSSTGQGAGATSQALQPLIIGVLAIAVARRPEGISGQIRARLRPLWQRVLPWASDDDDDDQPASDAPALELVPDVEEAHVGA